MNAGLPSVVVVSYNSAAWLPGCFASLHPSNSEAPEILLVDNASADKSADLVECQYPDVRILRCQQNLGFAGAANLGLRESGGEVVVILNPDVSVDPASLMRLAEALAADPNAAIAGCKLLYPDGKTIQHAGGTLSYPLALAGHYGYGEDDQGQCDEARNVDYVTGAVFAVKKAALAEIGYFDEGFFPAYFEEADLCFRARQAGYHVLYTPKAVAIHHESVTTGKNTYTYYHLYHRNRLRFILKHWSDEQLWDDFLLAELDRLTGLDPEAELPAVHQAYAECLAAFEEQGNPQISPSNAIGTPSGRKRFAALRVLEGSSQRALGATKGDPGTLQDHLIALRSACQVTERPFTSGLPAIGPFIVRWRHLWNWMSTKWYIRPMLEQQNAFNSSAVEMMRVFDLSVQALEGSVVALERERGASQRDLARLETRLRRLEERISEIQRVLERSETPLLGQ